MSNKHKILFVCIHNSVRSQMAEAFLKKYGGDTFEAESAGLEPGTLNPNVVKVMQEIGIDLTGKPTQGVFEIEPTTTFMRTRAIQETISLSCSGLLQIMDAELHISVSSTYIESSPS
jgi:hypothetical protein